MLTSLLATWATLFLCICTAAPVWATLSSRENPVVRTVRSVSPAVVNISSEYEIRKQAHPFSGLGMNPFFDSFFRDFFDPGFQRRYKRHSLGSGVIIDGQRGFILTNEHVLAKTGKITVILKDAREFEAQIVGADPDSDLAVLRINSKSPLPAIQMGRSDDLLIGETVIAIGNPFGFSHTVTTGVISAVNRSFRADDRVYHDFIQIDASINPGNSGGPLLNIDGQLIGINTAIYAKAQGIGFAIPIQKAKRIISDLIRHGEVIPAWLGLTVQNMDEKLAQYLKVPAKGGAIIKDVTPDSPAANKGIKAGDILLALGGKKILCVDDYHAALNGVASGDTLSIEIWRNGKKQDVAVTASIFPMELSLGLAQKMLGIMVAELSLKNKLAYRIRAQEGVMISELNPHAYLARIGVRPGDVLRQIEAMTVTNIDDFKKALIKYRQKKSLVILLQRGDRVYYITVKPA